MKLSDKVVNDCTVKAIKRTIVMEANYVVEKNPTTLHEFRVAKSVAKSWLKLALERKIEVNQDWINWLNS